MTLAIAVLRAAAENDPKATALAIQLAERVLLERLDAGSSSNRVAR